MVDEAYCYFRVVDCLMRGGVSSFWNAECPGKDRRARLLWKEYLVSLPVGIEAGIWNNEDVGISAFLPDGAYVVDRSR